MSLPRSQTHETKIQSVCVLYSHIPKRKRKVDQDLSRFPEWTVPTTMEAVLERVNDHDPKFVKFCKLAENPKIWQMRSLGPIPIWIKGRTCLAGDAAHAMMPSKPYHERH